MTALVLAGDLFTSLTLASNLAKLNTLILSQNRQLTNLFIPLALSGLKTLELDGTHFSSLTLPSYVHNLTRLDLRNNQMTSIAVPAGIPNLEPPLADLSNSGVQVTLFPVIKSPQRTVSGDFSFEVFADTGTFSVFRSTDLTNWTAAGSVTVGTPNYPGTAFTDTMLEGPGKVFYEIRP